MQNTFPSRVNRTTRAAGFTLLELLLVIFVIMLLMGALFAALAKLRQRARIAATQALIEKVKAGYETYRLKYRGYPQPIPIAEPAPAAVLSSTDVATNNNALYTFLTTAYRESPDAAKGEVLSTINVGPVIALEPNEFATPPSAGKTCIVDAWGTPLRFYYKQRSEKISNIGSGATSYTLSAALTPVLYSCGPNALDEKGGVDDIAGKE
jgi:type II secretory pathway pseudopilin PulG